ncbi:MAG: hypothetical protein K6F69_09920, partial [Treponema sp.]|nr:hypothetical protein [Treponema sp.]
IAKTVMELAALNLIYAWLVFVDASLYESKDHVFRNFKFPFYIMAVFGILLVLNLFTGIMFTINDKLWYDATLLYHIMELVEAVYVLWSFYLIHRYRKYYGKLHFFRVWPMMMPIVVGITISLLTNFSAIHLGLTIGAIGLYFSMMETFRYEEPRTGFFNKHYLKQLIELAGAKEYDYSSAFVIETKEDLIFADIIRKEVPKRGEIIHLKEGKFLFFSINSKKNLINAVKNMIYDAADEYEDNHKGTELGVSVQTFIKKKGEKTSDFIKKFMQQ